MNRERCCWLLDGLANINAAACLCTVLKANILDIPLRVPIDISLHLDQCGCTNYPLGLTCPGH
ncbi:cortical cell-delineating protein-like [Panicum miliaceum]|uniref:Cortical cell-delineating protein-like n=1 Tax=Panicum miliaceum TaxID=4540 RepID=A0A3L6TS12_PANMI|nr:cortical cell-delineating protein-like [Panicum miliaceum]